MRATASPASRWWRAPIPTSRSRSCSSPSSTHSRTCGRELSLPANALRSVCVFCGSYAGDREEYAQAAVELGEQLVARDCALVYGGGRVGLMGVIADAVLAVGGRVTGVIPEHLVSHEVAH